MCLQGGLWSFQPKDAEAVEVAAAAAAAEQAEAAARKVFLQDWAAAVATVGQQRPHSVAEQQQQWLSGPHADRVQALMVRGTDTHWGRKKHPEHRGTDRKLGLG